MADKYTRKSSRMQWWDYGLPGNYFVTLCTKNRIRYFGSVIKGKMIYSPQGAVAHVLWSEINNHAERAFIGPFVVMPDHIHGIITLKPQEDGVDLDVSDENFKIDNEGKIKERNADRDLILSEYLKNMDELIESNEWPGESRFQNQGCQTLSSIVGSYKSAVSKYLNRMNLESGWQRSFYDFLIKDRTEYEVISKYIRDNPRKWWLKYGENG